MIIVSIIVLLLGVYDVTAFDGMNSQRRVKQHVGNPNNVQTLDPVGRKDGENNLIQSSSSTRRIQAASGGHYTGLTIAGPSGNVGAGEQGGYGSDVWVNQGSSGTIVVENAATPVTTPVQVAFSNIPNGYILPAGVHDQIIDFIRNILQTNLDPSMEFVDVSYAGILPCRGGGIRNDNWQTNWKNNNNNNNNGAGQGMGWNNQNNQSNQNNSNNNWNGVQNQNGQTAWNNQNGGWQQQQNNWQQQQLDWQNQQANWQNQQANGVHGSGAGTDWYNHGRDPNAQWNNNGMQNANNNGGAFQNGSGGCLGGGPSVPLVVTIEAPSHLQSSVNSYVIQAIQSNLQGLLDIVRNIGIYELVSASLNIGTFDMGFIVDSTNMPTPNPTRYPTLNPSRYPTSNPTQFPTPNPSRRPTPFPVPVPPTPVTIPVQIALTGVTNGYRLPDSARESIVGYIRVLLESNLNPEFQLVDVTYAGILPCQTAEQTSGGCLSSGPNTKSVPLSITVNVPPYLAESAQNYIILALQTEIQNLTNFVRPIDVYALSNVILFIGTYEIIYIVDSTSEPTLRPVPAPQLTPQQPQPQRPRPQPAQEPAQEPEDEVEKTVPMQFNLDDLADGYMPSPEDQEAILDIIKDVIGENLDDSLDLDDVSYSDGSSSTNNRNLRKEARHLRQNSLYLPLDVTIKGPSGKIDEAYPNLLEIAEKHREEIMERLKEYDPETFKDVEVSSEAYDAPDLTSSTTIATHPVHVFFNKVAAEYELSSEHRTSFIGYIKKMLKEEIDFEWELIQVAYASRFELEEEETPSLPVRITVRGPKEKKTEQVLDYIMDMLESLKPDFEENLQDLDRRPFRDVFITFESHDLPPVTEPTFVTDHPVALIIRNIPATYTFDTKTQTAIISFVKDLIADNIASLDDSLELIDIASAGEFDSTKARTLNIPLEVTVRGPAEASDKTTSYVKEIVMQFDLDFKDYLSSLDIAFVDADISVEPFDFDSIIVASDNTLNVGESVHFVKLVFKNASKQFTLSLADQASILRFVHELLDDHLDESLTLIEVANEGFDRDSKSMRLRILVSGPDGEKSFALSFVMDVLDQHKEDLQKLLKAMDWNSLKNARIEIEVYDPSTEKIVLEETILPIQLVISDAPGRLSEGDRRSILLFVKESLQDNLDPFNLIKVAGAPVVGDGMSAPLLITVEGPVDEDILALSLVMEALESHKEDLTMKLKPLDWNKFKDAIISFGPYGPSAIGIDAKETVHYIRFNFDGVPVRYQLTEEDMASLFRFVNDMFEDSLDGDLELVQAAHVLSRSGQSLESSTQLDTLSVFFRITVRGPADISGYALAYVMDHIGAHAGEILANMQSLDFPAFDDALFSFETYDPNDIKSTNDEPMEVTVHPVNLIINDVQTGYVLSRDDRASIIRFLEEILDENLNNPFQLVDVIDSSKVDNRSLRSSLPGGRRLDTLSLPIQLFVKGPTGRSPLAVSYVMNILKDHLHELEEYLKSLRGAFIYAQITMEFNDPPSMEETLHPVQLILQNTNPTNRLSGGERDSLIHFIEEHMDDSLDLAFELISVSYAGRRKLRDLSSDFVSLPLLVRVRGPESMTEFAPAYVLQSIRDIFLPIELYLRSLDANVYMDTRLSVQRGFGNSESNIVITEEESKTAWWVWFLLWILLLICCCPLCCYVCLQKYKEFKEKTLQKYEDEMIIEETEHTANLDDANQIVPHQPTRSTAIFPYHSGYAENQHRNRTLQIMPSPSSFSESTEESSECNLICIPANASSANAARSTLTFDVDPPSEHNLMLLSRGPVIDSNNIAIMDTSTEQHDGHESSFTSVVPGQDNPKFNISRETMLICNEEEFYATKKPSVVTRSISSVMSKISNALVVHRGNESASHAAPLEEPSGIYDFGEQQSNIGGQSHSYGVSRYGKQPSTNIQPIAGSVRSRSKKLMRYELDERSESQAESFATQPCVPGAIQLIAGSIGSQSKKLMRYEWDEESDSRVESIATQAATPRAMQPIAGSVGSRSKKLVRYDWGEDPGSRVESFATMPPPAILSVSTSRKKTRRHQQSDSASGLSDVSEFYYGRSNSLYV